MNATSKMVALLGELRREMNGAVVDSMREKGIDAYLTPSFDDAEDFLRKHWNEGDVVVTLGCGDIDLLNEQILIHGDTDR